MKPSGSLMAIFVLLLAALAFGATQANSAVVAAALAAMSIAGPYIAVAADVASIGYVLVAGLSVFTTPAQASNGSDEMITLSIERLSSNIKTMNQRIEKLEETLVKEIRAQHLVSVSFKVYSLTETSKGLWIDVSSASQRSKVEEERLLARVTQLQREIEDALYRSEAASRYQNDATRYSSILFGLAANFGILTSLRQKLALGDSYADRPAMLRLVRRLEKSARNFIGSNGELRKELTKVHGEYKTALSEFQRKLGVRRQMIGEIKGIEKTLCSYSSTDVKLYNRPTSPNLLNCREFKVLLGFRGNRQWRCERAVFGGSSLHFEPIPIGDYSGYLLANNSQIASDGSNLPMRVRSACSPYNNWTRSLEDVKGTQDRLNQLAARASVLQSAVQLARKTAVFLRSLQARI